MFATPVRSWNSEPPTRATRLSPLEGVGDVVHRGPREQFGPDGPQLGQQQRDGCDPGDDMDTLGHTEEVDGPGGKVKPVGWMLRQVVDKPGEEAHAEGHAETDAEHRGHPLVVQRTGESAADVLHRALGPVRSLRHRRWRPWLVPLPPDVGDRARVQRAGAAVLAEPRGGSRARADSSAALGAGPDNFLTNRQTSLLPGALPVATESPLFPLSTRHDPVQSPPDQVVTRG